MAYRFLVSATFESLAHAEDAMAQMQQRATNTKVLGGSEGRTSYARLDNPDGSVRSMWYVDIFGIVRSGEYLPYDVAPAWIKPTGGVDSYPVNDANSDPVFVEYGGQYYRNDAGTVNSWDIEGPGAFGWTLVTEQDVIDKVPAP